jgi:PPOX class probable F420-dependent enzyme
MSDLSRSTAIIARGGARLAEAPVIWLTTVSPNGQPQTSPVWYIIDADELLVYSLDSPRVRNIEANPHVALNLDGDGEGGDVVTLEGIARIVADHAPCWEVDEYVTKYDSRITDLGHTPESFGNEYHKVVRIRLTNGRVW